MNTIFQAHLCKFALVFFDDILINSPDWTLHLENVKQVFEILRNHQLYVKHKKYIVGAHELEYLGYIVTAKESRLTQSRYRQWSTRINLPPSQNSESFWG